MSMTTTIKDALRSHAWRGVEAHLENTLNYARGGYAVAILRDIEDRVEEDDLTIMVVPLARRRDAKKMKKTLHKMHRKAGLHRFMSYYHIELSQDFKRRIDAARAEDGLPTY